MGGVSCRTGGCITAGIINCTTSYEGVLEYLTISKKYIIYKWGEGKSVFHWEKGVGTKKMFSRKLYSKVFIKRVGKYFAIFFRPNYD